MNEERGSRGGHNDRLQVIKNIKKRYKKLLEEQLKIKLKLKKKEEKKKREVVSITAVTKDDVERLREIGRKDAKKPEIPKKQVVKITEKNNEKQFVIVPVNIDEIIKEKSTDINNEPIVVLTENEIKKDPVIISDAKVKKDPVIIPEKKEEKDDSKLPIFIPDVKKAIIVDDEKIKISNSLEKEEIKQTSKLSSDEINRQAIETEINRRIKECYSELRDIEYKQKIILNHVDDASNIEEINGILKKIEELITELENMLIEFKNNEFYFDQNYLQELGIELTSKISNREDIGLGKYANIYLEAIDKINSIKNSILVLKDDALNRSDEINIADDEFNKDSADLDDMEKLKNEVDKFIEYSDKEIIELRDKIASSIDVGERTRFVMDGIDNRTNNLMRVLSVMSFIPGAAPLAAGVMTAVTTTNMMRELIAPQGHFETERYLTVTDYSIDIDDAAYRIDDTRNLVTESMANINDLIKECADRYSTFPEYAKIIDDLNKVYVKLEEFDIELENLNNRIEKRSQENKKIVKEVNSR